MFGAYSTNDVGNSGWRAMKLTPNFVDYEFTYEVPVLGKGGRDYIGLFPSKEDVEIKEVSVVSID